MMISIKALLDLCWNKIYNFNIFTPEEDLEGRTNNETTRKFQRYATRLYIVLFMISFYLLFFAGLMSPKTDIMVVKHMTPDLFIKLQHEHADTLSCPCSTTTIPYKLFATTRIVFHSICSSNFANKQWIEAFHLPNRSYYYILDFRTTAYSQFKLLVALCSISEKIVHEALDNFGNTDLVSIDVLTEHQVKSQIEANVELVLSNTPIEITSPLNFIRIIIRAGAFLSALSTNVKIQFRMAGTTIIPSMTSTSYRLANDVSYNSEYSNCEVRDPIAPSGFYLFPNDTGPYLYSWPLYPTPKSTIKIPHEVDGFFGGCYPLDALLGTTFECLYNIKCIQILKDYFPSLTQLDSISLLSSSNKRNISLNNLLSKLFIEQQSTTIDYSTYFYQCSPVFCTYSTPIKMNLSYGISLLLSLYAGLAIILRLLAPLLISIILKIRYHLNNIDLLSSIRHFSICIKELNLFQSSNERQMNDIKQQRMITRIYLICLSACILILLLFNSFHTKIVTTIVPTPSLTDYTNLYELHPSTLKCPCRNPILPYQTFVSFDPSLHSLCSSDLISEKWLSILQLMLLGDFHYTQAEWLPVGIRYFSMLSSICLLANTTIDDAVNQFLFQSFITTNVLTEIEFNNQLNITINEFMKSTISYFTLLIDVIHTFILVDQPLTVFDRFKLSAYHSQDDQSTAELYVDITYPLKILSTSPDCICSINTECHIPIALTLELREIRGNIWEFIPHYLIPGLFIGCSILDSLYYSTLECFYSDNECFYTIVNFTYSIDDTIPLQFDVSPLVYDPISSHFPPNTSLSTIIKQLMVDQWNSLFSFNQYYNACAPIQCTYSEKIHSKTFIQVIITLLSSIAGLISALRLIIPILIKFIRDLFKSKVKQQKIHQNLFTRIKNIFKNTIKFMYTKLGDLNLFNLRSFGTQIDRANVEHLGLLTKEYEKPSLNTYRQLIKHHPDTLECPCSKVSSPYSRSVTIQPVFHQICSSSFVSNEYRVNIIEILIGELSLYDVTDYRRFLSAHLVFLSGLCNLSRQSVENSINQLLSSLLTTTRLLPEIAFKRHINSSIVESQTEAGQILFRLIFLLRNILDGNEIMSTYATNFKYIWYIGSITSTAITKGMIYDECSCEFNKTCTTQANFIDRNSLELIEIKGLKMGCTPSESLLRSTLECFYNLTCIDILENQLTHTENTSIFQSQPLIANLSHYSVNTTIEDLVNNVFIEQWSTMINYSSYFDQCLPALCSYTYTQQINSLYTVTMLLSIYGGLSVVLKWICPLLILLASKLYKRWKNRSNIVSPVSTMTVINCESKTPYIDPLSMRSSHRRTFIFGCTIFILVFMTIIVTSIYIFQINNSHHITISSKISTTTITVTIHTDVSTLVTSSTSNCEITFESIISYTGSSDNPYSFALGDFDNDGNLDIIIANLNVDNFILMFGNGNGTFENATKLQTSYFTFPFEAIVADLNNDSALDLTALYYGSFSLGVFLGNNDGTFKTEITIPPEDYSNSRAIVMGDFNNDNYDDVIVTSCDFWTYNNASISLFYGNGDGTFQLPITFLHRNSSHFFIMKTIDLNHDNQLDLIFVDDSFRGFYVLYGNGDGTFQPITMISINSSGKIKSFIIKDINNDSQLDIIMTFTSNYLIGVLIGNEDEMFGNFSTFTSGIRDYPNLIDLTDLNNDGLVDLITNYLSFEFIAVFFGIGIRTGTSTRVPIQYATRSDTSLTASVAIDINNDGQLDIIGIDYEKSAVLTLLNTCDCCTSTHL